ncbi:MULTISPECIES: 3-hexulose-6-phosphate synthase [Fervidicoccus]|uniref:3-hexulose-6-phosphate synthase n=1 Tax=Fervidicoccus fontis (strain DSM 19380 / JCM 18336 / VKM B-2539 / Kam940) TaxID=1163730 RepID=I0A086_FERFK|nr:3-hexulose-6-phosphate synthase [Fervidicoccus fontis]AFH42393.1 hexulose-6-phosphate synthase (D-arabino 3-hexulose-6-phosphate formaldehyde lyase) [Fervidicoccus fontis Kam940]
MKFNTLKEPPYLQVAIDVTDLKKALFIVRQVIDLSDKIIIEVGTPLIKSYGMLPVEIISYLYPEKIILADMKTMDVGYLEANLAFKSGATISTVLGAADNETIQGALKASLEYNKFIQVDLINVKDLASRAREVAELGVHIVGLHAGIDQQTNKKLRAIDMIELLKEIKNAVEKTSLVSIAGGIKQGELKRFAENGADIIVVGGAITSSEDPREVAKNMLKEIL